MKLIHFSDSHAGEHAESWKAYLDKRWVGIFNYNFRRKFQHDQSILKKAVNYMLNSDADLFVCTGDITSTGQPSEFKKALDILSPLNETKKLIYIPGNHDFYVYDSDCNKALLDAFKFLNNNRFSLSDLPLLLDAKECEILLVNTSWPTNLISSNGYLKKEHSAKIVDLLQHTKKPVIFITHYPIIERKPWLRIRHKIFGEYDVKNMLLNGKIDIALCGHVHKPFYIRTGNYGRGQYCSGSVTKNSSISQITYDKNTDSFSACEINI